MEDLDAGDLGPAEPGEKSAQHEENQRDDEAGPAHPAFAPPRREQHFGEQNGQQDDVDALVDQRPEQIDVIDPEGAGIDLALELDDEGGERGLLDQAFLGDGEHESQEEQARPAEALAAHRFADQNRADAPDAHLDRKYEDRAEPRRARQYFGKQRREQSKRECRRHTAQDRRA
jgi:hypothetical protein